MGVYLYTTNTITKRINYFYRCSQCGSIIGQSAFISRSANFNRYGGAASEKNAEMKATVLADNAENDALNKARNGDYRPFRIKSKCPKCKHREPWQKLGVSPVVYFTPLLLVIGIIWPESFECNPRPSDHIYP